MKRRGTGHRGTTKEESRYKRIWVNLEKDRKEVRLKGVAARVVRREKRQGQERKKKNKIKRDELKKNIINKHKRRPERE